MPKPEHILLMDSLGGHHVEHVKRSIHVSADVATCERGSLLAGVTQSLTKRTRLTSASPVCQSADFTRHEQARIGH